jgi:serine protease Do
VAQSLTSDLAESLGLKSTSGAVVTSVADDSPAERAGFKRGDVITAFNGQPVADSNVLRNRVADAAPGSKATVGIVRDGSEKTLTVTLAERAGEGAARADEPASDDKAALGVSVSPLTADAARELGMPRNAHGVVVESVNQDGRAADAGVRQGDVILEVNRQPVNGVEDLRAAVRKSSDKPLLLLVHRKDGDLYLTVASR